MAELRSFRNQDRVWEGEEHTMRRGAHRLPTDRHIRKDSMTQWKLISFFPGENRDDGQKEREKRGF